ncbi:hypothetical protein A9Q86_08860 [Flavobacteriales bacterium 33_180_T64]|nr:hypothetical protein A9Q86_08860 [Flavobacteriales bacterium 33_180_T64]
MKKTFFATLILVILTFIVVVFIEVSNDHAECAITKTLTYGENGEKIVSKAHTCKEKFNL